LAELEQWLRMREIRGAQVEVVIIDAESFEIDGALGSVAASCAAKVDCSSNL
jgi:hypothetical protein